jgi:two-component system, NtrC family, response regulator HydG
MGRILIVDDEPHMRKILAAALALDKHATGQASGVAEARKHLSSSDFDAMFTDQRLADGDGLQVLAAAREADPALSVVFLTAVATIQLAVESMRQGAFDFVTKPFQPEVVRAAANRACEHTWLLRENGLLRDAVGRLQGSSEIFGTSPVIQEIRQLILRVAPTNAAVLILGETGTGKELVARALHTKSQRAAKPFVALNCAALSQSLIESELFGHERGAFTGAEKSRPGLFEAAHEGTLFLDEIGEMPLEAQAKLLRVLTDGQVLRIGANKPRQVDVRVLAATHRNLEQRIREGTFREDLYYRLVVIPISIPPLRDRTEDIPALCELFLQLAARDLNTQKHRLSPAAMECLLDYSFPGNIRELKNLIERACILSRGIEIGPESFPVSGTQAKQKADSAGVSGNWLDHLPESVHLRSFLAETEKALIERTLKETRGAQAEAARRLGLTRSDLSYKLSKYGITLPENPN